MHITSTNFKLNQITRWKRKKSENQICLKRKERIPYNKVKVQCHLLSNQRGNHNSSFHDFFLFLLLKILHILYIALANASHCRYL